MNSFSFIPHHRQEFSQTKPYGEVDDNSDDYFLFCEEEKQLMNAVEPRLVAECQAGNLSWNDPLPMMVFLKRAIQEYEGVYKIHFPTHANYLGDMLSFMQNNINMKTAADVREKTPAKSNAVADWGLGFSSEKESLAKRKLVCESDFFAGTPSLRMCNSNKKRIISSTESTVTAVRVCEKRSSAAIRRLIFDTSRSSPKNSSHLGAGKSGEGTSNDNGEIACSGDTLNVDSPGARRPRNDIVFVIRRKLNKSDMCPHQHRISMPCSHVTTDFLTEEELLQLERKVKIPIKVIDPEGRPHPAQLRKTMAGCSSYSYGIGKPWNDIKKMNGFELGTVLNIWALRGDDRQLCILLQRVAEES